MPFQSWVKSIYRGHSLEVRGSISAPDLPLLLTSAASNSPRQGVKISSPRISYHALVSSMCLDSKCSQQNKEVTPSALWHFESVCESPSWHRNQLEQRSPTFPLVTTVLETSDQPVLQCGATLGRFAFSAQNRASTTQSFHFLTNCLSHPPPPLSYLPRIFWNCLDKFLTFFYY